MSVLRKVGKWLLIAVGALLVAFSAWSAQAAIRPITSDPFIPDEQVGAGSSSVEPSYSGLQREFPPVAAVSAESAELGRQLFFDPILSGNDDMSCASCHHPDKGFSDGQALAVTSSGSRLQRNTPTLWESAYAAHLFWDGRAKSLEEQADIALTTSSEMNADPDQLVAELAAIPAYGALFEAAYGSSEISYDGVVSAIAAFERTLTADNAPFDRYAAGEFDALTPQQRRGLGIFRSGATRCFECHTAPTFASDTFRVIGVPSEDEGRAGFSADAPAGAFKVPTLRNIAFTAPYMHNGSIATLEEVVEFYAEGGGAAHGMSDNLDNFVQGFTLTDQEKEDLIAFLYALTDESQLPELPTVALSGLPTVTALDQPQRAIAARINSPVGGGQPTAGAPRELYVQAGESVQDTVDRARPGDTILVPYARYNERVVIDMSDITLRGVPNANGQYPIFDGQNRLPEAVISSGNNFTISHLHVRNYTDNGILVEGVTNVHFHDLISENTGTYGIYPVRSTDVLIERVTASGVNDAAIYAGQCENVIVRDSEVFDSVLGIEIENSLNGDVYNNYAHDNSVGIFYVVLPNLNSKASRGGKVYDNRVVFNNTENFAEANMAAALVPSGVGILLLGSDNIEVTNNTIRNNKTTGVAVFSLTVGYDPDEIDVAPNPDNNWIHNNIYENNGYKPDSFVAGMGIPTGDILWDGSGWDNRFDEPTAQGGFPPILPGSSTATPWVKIYYRLLNTAIRVAG